MFLSKRLGSLQTTFRVIIFIVSVLGLFSLSGIVTAKNYHNKQSAIKFSTTLSDGSVYKKNHFESRKEVYFHTLLKKRNHGWNRWYKKHLKTADGDYVFQVTNPNGRILLSSEPAKCRIIKVENGYIVSLREPIAGGELIDRVNDDDCNTQDDLTGSPPGNSQHHDTNIDLWNGEPAISVQLMPFIQTPNPGNVYKLWLTPWNKYLRFQGDPNQTPVGICHTRSTNQCASGEEIIGYARDRGFRHHRFLRTHNFKVNPELENLPPIANAGPDQPIEIGDLVSLDGSNSYDPEGKTLTLAWTIIDLPLGSNAFIDDPSSVTPLLQTDLPGSYTLSLVVNDGSLSSSADLVVVSTGNTPPEANAGVDQSIAVANTATLDGSASNDDDGDSLTYSWIIASKPLISNAELIDSDKVNPSFVVDVAGSYEIKLIVFDGADFSTEDSMVVSTINSPPIANAGADQSSVVGSLIQLDSSGSTDPDGDNLGYFWSLTSQPAGSITTISNATASMPQFLIDRAGSYTIQLVANDGNLDSAPDFMTVTTLNSAPLANAGPDQSVFVSDVVTLDGSNSSDIDGDTLFYNWSLSSKPANSTATLSDSSAIAPQFILDVPGTYVAQLIVFDGIDYSIMDSVNVTTGNSPPVANAGPDQSETVNSLIVLDGSNSSDPDFDSLSYLWSFVDKPISSIAVLQNSDTVNPEFTIDIAGDYILQLRVSDGILSSAIDTVVITTQNSPPVANAGIDQTTASGSIINLDGSGSSDPDGDDLSYNWVLTVPAGSNSTLSDSASEFPTFDADIVGIYTAALIVSDGNLSSVVDEVLISVTNTAPIANAGSDQTAVLNTIVTLDGSQSSDVDGDNLTFLWELSAPVGSLAVLNDPSSIMPTFEIDLAGSYTISLTVNDGTDNSVIDEVIVNTINSPPVANAGPDQTAAISQSVTLDGSQSTDVDGDNLEFLWILSAPTDSLAVLNDAASIMPTFEIDLQGSYTLTLTVNDGLVDSDPDEVIINTVNTPPVANAGPNQTRSVTDLVTLDGSGSTDIDGDSLIYIWSFTNVPTASNATLSDASASMPTLTIDEPGVYIVQLVVNDGLEDSTTPATVTITTQNSAPVADAGDNGEIEISIPVTLDASGSTDVDGDSLIYAWSLTVPDGSATTLSSNSTIMPTFTPDTVGDYLAQLIVNDGEFDSTPDTVLYSTANIAPIAVAGMPQTVALNQLVILNGSGSSDADGDTLSYQWSLTVPVGSTATLNGMDTVSPTFTIDQLGDYIVQLIVNDGILASNPDTVTVSTINSAPVADAGLPQDVNVGVTVTLDGSGSADADGDPLNNNWSIISKPEGSTSELIGETTVAPTFTADVAGLYIIQLIVDDNELSSTPDTVVVSVGSITTITLEDEVIGVGRSTTATASISMPAPSGGLTLDLSLDDPLIASFGETSLFFAEGETEQSFEITGLISGVTQINSSGNGASTATAKIEVIDVLVSIDTIETIAPGETTSFVISISEPAPPQGLLITLTLEDTSIATVSPQTVFVAAGQVTPTANAQIFGVNLGSTKIKATAPGFAPDMRDIHVSFEAEFDPTPVAVQMPFKGNTVLKLDAPAPAGGITFDLSVDDDFITVPAQISIPEGQTQSPPIELSGLIQGSTLLKATAPNVTDTTTLVNVTALNAFLTQSSSHTVEAIVGLDLQVGRYSVRMAAAPPSAVDIRVSVPAGSGVLISKSGAEIGSESILFEDITGATTPLMSLQGTALGDDVPLTIEIFEANSTTSIGYNILPSTVDVDPSGIYISSTDYSTTTFSADRTVRAAVTVLYDEEGPGVEGNSRSVGNTTVRAGKTISVPMVTSDSAIAVLRQDSNDTGSATDTISILEATSVGSILVDPLTSGVATISIDTPLPPNLSIPGNLDDNVVVTIDASNAFLTQSSSHIAEAIVGLDLQAGRYSVRMAAAPPSAVDIRVSVPAGSGVLISKSGAEIGTETVLFEDITNTTTPFITLQGIALGDDVPLTIEIFEANSTTPIGYNILPSTVDVDPSGVFISGNDYSTTTFSADRTVRAAVTVLYDEEGPGVEGNSRSVGNTTVRAGKTISVPMVTSDSAIAVLRQDSNDTGSATGTISILEATSVGSILVDPLSSGVATISIDTPLPPNLSIPGNLDDNVVVTIDAPDTKLSFAGLGQSQNVDIGDEFQLSATIQLQVAPPAGNPVDVTIEVTDSSVVLISKDVNTIGTNVLVYSSVTSASAGNLYVQGLALGSATQIKVSAPGYDDWLVDVEVIKSGFRLVGSTTVNSGSTTNLSVIAVSLNSNDTIKDSTFQRIRGGTTQNIVITSSDPSTGTVVSPVILNGGDISKISLFTAVAPGSTTVEITQPSGFIPPVGQTELDITVN